MKTTRLQSLFVIVASILFLTHLPFSHVHAQEESESETTSVEESLTESSAVDEDGTDAGQPAQLFSEMILSGELVDQSVTAVEDYQDLLTQITYRDLASMDLTGTTIEEAQAIELSVEGQYSDQGNGMTLGIYAYDEGGLTAEILLIFADGHLAYAGVMNLALTFDPDNMPSDESVDLAAAVGTSIDSFNQQNPMVSGVGQMQNNGEFVTTTFLFTGTSPTALVGNFVLFDEAEVIHFVRADFQNILGDSQILMFNLMTNFSQQGHTDEIESSIEAY